MDLFTSTEPKENNDFLHRQLIKLGDMMGDGLHHEPDGKWIEKEYKQIAQILFPEMYVDIAKRRSEAVDKQMQDLLKAQKCDCGGVLKQSRRGSKVCSCLVCGNKYRAKNKK